MEDVLEVYQRPHDLECPVVCLDESSKQLIAETRMSIPAKPGHPARHDYEYERNGTVNLFMMFAPLEGWRHVLSGQCLDRRIGDKQTLVGEVAAPQQEPHTKANWQFTAANARIKLK